MTTQRPDGLPVILDVDTGIDDALALAYAVAQPALDIVAVTTVAGNIDVYRATANTRNVLSFLGREDIPVHRGATRPLVRPHHTAPYVHGDDGLGGADLPESRRAVDEAPGPATIIRLARERPDELTLIAVGPLTNLAIALNVEPRVAEWIPRVVVMGGAYHVPGNRTPHAEFNAWSDPEAADQVVSAGFRDLTLIGLDVTMGVSLRHDVWEALEGQAARSAPAELTIRVARQAFVDDGVEQFYLHDPLAVAVVLDPTLVTVEAVDVSVMTAGDEAGRTVVHGPGTTKVAREVDRDRFLAGLHHVIGASGITP